MSTAGNGRRVVLVTGASSGIGLAAACGFARRGDEVVLIGRDPQRLAAAAAQVRAAAQGPDGSPGGGAGPATFRADFAVLDEVRTLAEQLRAAYPKIHVLANNAGGVFPRRVTTVDGFELTMQANHLAPFLLTHLLRDRLDGRMVVTASAAHITGALDPDDLSSGRSGGYRAMQAYGASKQANILFAAEAARRWPGLLSTSYHPGVVRTRFGHDSTVIALFYRAVPFLRTPEQGADTMLWLADAPASEVANGGYYVARRLRSPARNTTVPGLATRLWQASLQAVGLG